MEQSLTEAQAVEILAECEEALSVLYTLYAGQHPDYSAFWSGLAHEEQAHKTWARALAEKVQECEVTFREGHYSPEAYQTFFTYINERIRDARKQQVALFAALSVAVDIESTIVEKSYYEVFIGESEEGQRLLNALASSAQAHYQRVKEMWMRCKPA